LSDVINLRVFTFYECDSWAGNGTYTMTFGGDVQGGGVCQVIGQSYDPPLY